MFWSVRPRGRCPGAGHLWLGRRKGLIFLIVLPLMFALGLALEGAHFSDRARRSRSSRSRRSPNMGIGVPYFIARPMGYGAGDVIAVTYEYGNTFLIVAGLLNALVVIDAFDIAMGRKVAMFESHFVLMVMFSLFVSAVFAGLMREERARAADARRKDVRRHAGRSASCSAG